MLYVKSWVVQGFEVGWSTLRGLATIVWLTLSTAQARDRFNHFWNKNKAHHQLLQSITIDKCNKDSSLMLRQFFVSILFIWNITEWNHLRHVKFSTFIYHTWDDGILLQQLEDNLILLMKETLMLEVQLMPPWSGSIFSSLIQTLIYWYLIPFHGWNP